MERDIMKQQQILILIIISEQKSILNVCVY